MSYSYCQADRFMLESWRDEKISCCGSVGAFNRFSGDDGTDMPRVLRRRVPRPGLRISEHLTPAPSLQQAFTYSLPYPLQVHQGAGLKADTGVAALARQDSRTTGPKLGAFS